MNNEIRTGCIMQFYEIYPLSRKLVFDTFDQKKYHVTRTQQIVLLSLSVLLEKQKEGKKRMRQVGSIEVPQEAFMSVLRLDED